MSYLDKQIQTILEFDVPTNLELPLAVGVGVAAGMGIGYLIKHFLKLDCTDPEYKMYKSKLDYEINKARKNKDVKAVEKLEAALLKQKQRCER